MIPTFTVIIPTYNVRQYISATLNSVWAQAYSDFEVLVIDDGSIDGTWELIQSFRDPRLRLLRHQNHGVSYTRNRGIREARGRYIAFLDGDDQWLPCHLQFAADNFNAEQHLKWYAAPFKYVPEITAEMLSVKLQHGATNSVSYFGLGNRYAWSSSTVIDREALLAIVQNGIFFPEDMTHGEDLAAWVRFAISHPQLGTYHQLTAYAIQRPDSALGRLKNTGYYNLQMTGKLAEYFSHYSSSLSCSKEARMFMRGQMLVRWLIQLRGCKLEGWENVLRDTRQETPWLVRCWVASYVFCQSIFTSIGGIYIRGMLKQDTLRLQLTQFLASLENRKPRSVAELSDYESGK
jgi:glycosyltransferase involved in cell wall biosynthesis